MWRAGRQKIKKPLRSLLQLFVVMVFITAPFQLWAASSAESQPKNRFIQLVQSGQLQQAYQLAETLEDEWAGDADFDMAYGQIALQVGQNDRAIFALERVVADKPLWLQARFSLAQAYYKTKNYPAALQQISILEQQQLAHLAEPVAQLRRATTAAENKLKGHQRHKFKYGLGRDNNVNSGTAEDRIFIPSLGEIDVFPQSKASQDYFHQLAYSFDGRWQQDQRSAWLADIQLDTTVFHQLSEFDRESLAARLGYEADYQQYSYSLKAYSRPLRLGGQWYRNDWGGLISAHYQLNAVHTVGAQWTSGRSDNRLDDRLNLTLQSLSVSWERKGQRWINQASLSFSAERSRLDSADYNSRDISSFSYSNIWLVSTAHLLVARAELQDIKYKSPHPLFRVVRDERLFLFTGSWIWQHSAAVSTEFKCSYTDKNSPITLYQYDRTECVLGASYAF